MNHAWQLPLKQITKKDVGIQNIKISLEGNKHPSFSDLNSSKP